MLTEAIDAIRQGNKKQAKDILTRLIKTDQHNATFWVWMSAAVETDKERLYALQTALKADPENAAAKRGLVLMGAITLDEGIEPFPLNKPRLWEEQLDKDEEEKPRGIKGLAANPIIRLAGILVGVAGIIGFAIFGLSQRSNNTVVHDTNTPGPSPTYTLTPTAQNARPVATQDFIGAAPLWALLDVTYTPTPLYVNTPRSVQASDYGYAVKSAYANEDWKALISAMEQITTLEPESADPYYYIGEGHRFMGENSKAFAAYENALDVDNDFAAGYLGRARVLPFINSNASILPDLDTAIEKDPNFAEAYLERAKYFYAKKDYENAFEDLQIAEELSPNSPDIYLIYAQIYWTQDELDKAITSAEKSLEIDITNLNTYLLLGQLYEANGDAQKSITMLERYTVYEEDDTDALSTLGGDYYALGEYEKALETLNHVIELNRHAGSAYYYRGMTYIALEEGEKALADLEIANTYLNDNFEASLALARANILIEHYGDCYLQVERTRPLAETEYQEALIYYWRATCHEGRDDIDSALSDWEQLLAMPFSARIGYLQAEGREHLYGLYTPTPTITAGPSPTPTKTRTPSPSNTPTKTTTPTPDE